MCLSVLKIILAAIRLGLAMTGGLLHGTRAISWLCIEGTMAIIMVASTASQGIFGWKQRQNRWASERARSDASPGTGPKEESRRWPIGSRSFMKIEPERQEAHEGYR